MSKGMISVRYGQLRRITACYAALPIVVFFIGCLRPVFAVLGVLACLAALWLVIRDRRIRLSHDRAITLSPGELAALLFVILAWTYCGGLNGFFFQSSDWGIRNAVYRDLVTHRWPVVYGSKMTALSYYVGHWLVPAAAAKPFYYLFGTRIGWFAARQLLWGWTACALVLICLNLMLFTGADTRRKRVLCVAVFIGFSGMDVLGAWLSGNWSKVTAPDTLHFEWWIKTYQFSSITTCVYWVFNQAVIPWLTVSCVLFEDSPENYLFWGMACLLCGPFPFVGLVILMLVKAGVFLWGEIKVRAWREAARAFFTPANLILLCAVFPVLALYYLSNNAVAAGMTSSAGAVRQDMGALAALLENIRKYLVKFIQVYVLDVGVYLFLLRGKKRRDPLFYAIALSLFILPYFRIGTSLDFAARSTIPGVFVLMAFVAEEAVDAAGRWRQYERAEKTRAGWLLAVFLAGLMTPGMEIYRGFYNVLDQGTVRLEDRSVMTLDKQPVSLNFETAMFTDSFFFKNLAKRPRTDTAAVVFSDGFYKSEKLDEDAPEASFRWAEEQAELVLFNGWTEPVEARLQMVFALAEDADKPYTVTVACGDRTWRYEISGAAQTVTVPVTMEDTATKVRITSDAEPILLPAEEDGEEGRTVCFSLAGARLYDGSGELLAGKAPQHPELETAAKQVG